MKKYEVIMIVALLFGVNAEAKKLYKWVDENGNVTYSDQVPPEKIQDEHQEINKDGVVLEDVQRAKTAEEIEQMRQDMLKQKELEKLAHEEEVRRQNIIKAYANENEIIRLKEERVYAIEKNIESAKQNLEFQKKSLEDMQSIAANHERSGKEVSKALLSRIDNIGQKIKDQHEFIEVKQQELDKVKLQFDKDLQVYRDAVNK